MSLRSAAGLISLALLAACTAEPPGGLVDGDAGTGSEADAGLGNLVGPFCGIYKQVIAPHCIVCHKPGGNVPYLTLPEVKTSIVNKTSTQFPGQTFVVPGNSGASFLYLKVAGDPGAGLGVRMPVANALGAADIAAVAQWINDGANTQCDSLSSGDGGVDFDAGTGRYHPTGFNDPAVHGLEMKMQMQDCRQCHGATLEGGAGPSCDSCHMANWRTTCTYCHGGTDSTSGAPPRDLDGKTNRDELTFRAHTEHTSLRNHAAWDCNQCHTKPDNVLSPNHAFDDTHGYADVDFGGGLSPAGNYTGSGQCSNLYCHGNGNGTLGSYDHLNQRPTCTTCHAGQGSTLTQLRTMSGQHRRHIGEGIPCAECHAEVVDVGLDIIDQELHVDGIKQVLLPNGMTRSGSTCSGTCHGENHLNQRW